MDTVEVLKCGLVVFKELLGEGCILREGLVHESDSEPSLHFPHVRQIKVWLLKPHVSYVGGGVAERDGDTDMFRFGEAEVRTGFVPDHRVGDLPNESDDSLCFIGQIPDKTIPGFLRILLEIKATKVGVIGVRNKVDSGGFIENGGESVGDRHGEVGRIKKQLGHKTDELGRLSRWVGCL